MVVQSSGTAAAGYVYDQATADIAQTIIHANKADRTATFVSDKVAYIRLEGNIFYENAAFTQATATDLLSVEGNNGFAGNMDFFYNTVALNSVFNHFFLDGTSSQQWLKINNSIIYDQGNIIRTTGATSPNLIADCNYVHESVSFSVAQSATDLFTTNPSFIDAANGNFHLDSQSFAMDLCNENSIQSNYKDLNGQARGFDNPNLIDLRGTYDAGAYEQYNDLIFRSSF